MKDTLRGLIVTLCRCDVNHEHVVVNKRSNAQLTTE